MVPALSELLRRRPHFHPTQRFIGVCGIIQPYLSCILMTIDRFGHLERSGL